MTSLHELLADVFAPFGAAETARITYEGPMVALSPTAVLPLSLILHELVTNASKYGALSVPAGKISIAWEFSSATAPRLMLRWLETGLSSLKAPTQLGFGTRMIEASTRHELGGKVDVVYGLDGVKYEFDFLLS